MKLLCIFAVFLAISLADEIKQDEKVEDALAVAPVSLQTHEELNPVTSTPHLKPRRKLKRRVRPRYYGASDNQPQNNYNQPQNNYNPPQNNYNPPQNNYNPPQNNYNPPQNNYNQPQNNYNQPQNNYNPTQNPQNTQNNYWTESWNRPSPYPTEGANYPSTTQRPWSTWSQAPTTAAPTTTTFVPVIKNEQSMGADGSYKYEYEIGDGTHVMEEGYLVNPNTENEYLVKKGMYSFTGADGKVYTVKYWADNTGYHAEGAHLPQPPPVPPAIQASIEQNAKEEAAKAEAEKNKPQAQQPPKPIRPPTQIQPKPQPDNNQQTNYPQQNYPQQNYPQQNYPQQNYPQQNYPEQNYPQQNYPQQNYPQQNYPQQSYPSEQQQQNNFYPPLSYGK
ncbi:unnamed protein product [Colias eurytheme]|nr:unnamed protein product [Colias eurytheme]